MAGIPLFTLALGLIGVGFVPTSALGYTIGNIASDFNQFSIDIGYRDTDLTGIGPEFSAAVLQDVRIKYSLALGLTATADMIDYASMERSFLKCRFDGYLEYCDHPFGVDRENNSDVTPPFHADFMIFDEPFFSAESPDTQNYPLFVIGVTPIFNLPGLDELVLSRETLAKIFRGCDEINQVGCMPGSITTWNHPDIMATNPPSTHTILNAAGPIKVIIQSDSSSSTEAFRSALCSFDDDFRVQVGEDKSSFWNGTNHIQVLAAHGVELAVKNTPGSISYVKLNMVDEVTGVTAVKILNSHGHAVEANTDSLFAAFQEIDLAFGNDGRDPAAQTVDLTGALGDRAWPISSLAYLVIRKEWTPANCTDRRRDLLEFLEYLYTNQGADSQLLVQKGFAPLTTAAGMTVLQLVRDQIKCDGIRVFQDPPAIPVVAIQADESMHHMLGLFGGAFQTTYGAKLVVEPVQSHLSIQRQFVCFANASCSDPLGRDGLVVLAGENLSNHIIRDDDLTNIGRKQYDLFSMPFTVMATGFVVNFCLPEDTSCQFKYKEPFVLDIETAARILDQKITWWNDSTIRSLNPGKILPQEKIIVVAGPKTSNFHFSFVDKVRNSYIPDFAFTGGGIGKETYYHALIEVTLYPYTITYAPFNGTMMEGTSRVALINGGGRVVQPVVKNIEACALDTYSPGSHIFSPSSSLHPDCYPLVEAYTLFMLSKMDKPIAALLAQYFFKQAVRNEDREHIDRHGQDYGNLGTVLSVSELGTLVDIDIPDGVDVYETNFLALEGVRSFAGENILLISHDLTLIPESLIILMYTLLALELGFFCYLAFWVIYHRNRKLVRNSSPVFMLQVLLGAAIMACTIIPLAQQDDQLIARGMTLEELAKSNPYLDGSCVAQPVLFSLGFFITFSALFLKSWRLIRIFNNKKLRNLFLRDRQLLFYQVMVITLVVILNMLWALRDPLVWQRFPAFIDTKSNMVVASYGICFSRTGIAPALPLLIGVMMVLVVGNYLSYLGRRIPTEFNESKWTAMSMVVTLEAFVIGLPILMLANSQPVPGFIIKSFCSLLVSGATVCLIFLPKLAMAYGWGLQPGDSNPWRFVKGESGSSGNKSGTIKKPDETGTGQQNNKVVSPSLNSLMEGKGIVKPPHLSVAKNGAHASTYNSMFSGNNLVRSSSNQLATGEMVSPFVMGDRKKSKERIVSSGNKILQGVKPTEALAKVLQDDPMRRRFRRYLQSLKMEENLRFWDSIAIFRLEPDEHKRFVSARAIIQTFVLDSAPLQVNLSSQTRNALLVAFTANDKSALGSTEFFETAAAELFEDLRQSDAFRQFLENDTFSNDNLSSKSDPTVAH